LKNDIAAVVVGIVLYLALGFVFHPLVVGRPVFPRPHSEPDVSIHPTQSRLLGDVVATVDRGR